jgi:hypothetical protein
MGKNKNSMFTHPVKYAVPAHVGKNEIFLILPDKILLVSGKMKPC